MKRVRSLQRRLHTLHALHEVVVAMKTLSAHHFRQCRKALSPARTYREEMEQILAEIELPQPQASPDVPATLLLIASDLGLCGDYNARLTRMAIQEYQEAHMERLFCVGRRPRNALIRAGLSCQPCWSAPTSVDGLPPLLLQIVQKLLEWYAEKTMGRLYVVSARFEGVGRFTPVLTQLLPVTPPAASSPRRPTPYESPQHLAAVTVREYLTITLYELLLDALAAEHGMRLLASESANQWLDGTTTTVHRQLSSSRREAATQELLDIVAGSRTTPFLG